MPSTIKMIAVVDGKETTVGRCHPGQARILRKQGLAEWKDGKLVFQQAPSTPPDAVGVLERVEAHSEPIPIERLEAALDNVQRRGKIDRNKLREMGWKGTQNFERSLDECPTRQLAQEALTEACEEVDPEHLVTGVCLQPGGVASQSPAVTVIRSATLEDYLNEIYTRREAGHALWAYEGPNHLGFTDLEDEVSFEVPSSLVMIAVNSENWTASGWPPGLEDAREHLRTWRGRQKMVGMPTVDFEDGEEGLLEDLWGPLEHDESGPLPFLGDWLPDVGPQK